LTHRESAVFINSTFHGFGSTTFRPTTGVAFPLEVLHFRLAEIIPTPIAPRNAPVHTIILECFAKMGIAVMPFGGMGGSLSAAGHAAFLSGVLDLGIGLQEAMDLHAQLWQRVMGCVGY